MFLEGSTLWEIADSLKAHRSTIQRDLAEARADWRTTAAADWRESQEEELARLRKIERESWVEIHRIRKARKRTEQESVSTYLARIFDCVQERVKILGLAAPKRNEVKLTGDASAPIQLQYLDGFNSLPIEHQESLIGLLEILSNSIPDATAINIPPGLVVEPATPAGPVGP